MISSAVAVWPFLQLDESHADLAHSSIGHTDHRNHGNLGVGKQEVLYLRRIGIHAAGDEHVLDAAGNLYIPLIVHDAQVAGVEPAVLVEGFFGFLGHLVILFHNEPALGANLALGAAAEPLYQSQGPESSGRSL